MRREESLSKPEMFSGAINNEIEFPMRQKISRDIKLLHCYIILYVAKRATNSEKCFTIKLK